MRKKFLVSLLSLTFAVAPLAGCGAGGEQKGMIRFWGYGDHTAKQMYTAMVEAYNKGQGKTDGVTVSYSNKPESGYDTLIAQSAPAKTGPDVFFSRDLYFKSWTAAGYISQIEPYVQASVQAGELNLDGIWKSSVDRFRYDKELNISDETKPLYGLPIDTSPTALYYNKTAIQNRGIIVISVDEDKMAAWNRGEIADNYGKKKSDYPSLANIEVPAKGFFRDDIHTRKTYGTVSDVSGIINLPVMVANPGTVMVFNDRIAMNWDEIEDIAWMMTSKGDDKQGQRPAPSTDYGYYTEWWFNYGWAVGGDCVVDLSGNGSWAYSHGDRSANYIVAEGKTFNGPITGTVYQAGETLEFLDKVDVKVGDVIRPDDKGGYTKNGAAWGPAETVSDTNDSITSATVKTAVENGTLIELPSMREAFTRFVNLAGVETQNLNVCPYPSSFTAVGSVNFFTSGKVAFLVERGVKLPAIDEYVNGAFEWACAPLPVFKEYTTPSEELIAKYGSEARANAYNTEVAREGKPAGHSDSIALAIREKSTKKDAAWKFVCWMAGEEAQEIKASYGFLPNQVGAVEGFYNKLDPNGTKNVKAFVEAAAYETPGDWWYMINNNWIDVWSSPLNSLVRNGEKSLKEFFDEFISKGNDEVERYGNFDGELGKVTVK